MAGSKLTPDALKTYHGLNALRGVAAIAVAALHFGDGFGVAVPGSAFLAVDLFFLMSGFVIAHVYEPKIAAGMTTIAFMRVRLFRFYPLYLLSLLLAAIRLAGLAMTNQSGGKLAEVSIALALALFFLPTLPGRYNLPDLYPLNGPTWSLGVELVVNAAFAAAHRWMGNRALMAIVLLSASILAAVSVWGDLNGGGQWANAHIGYLRGIFSFAAGVLLYRFRDKAAALAPLAPLAPIALAVCLFLEFGRWEPAYELLFMLGLSPLIIAMAMGDMPAWSVPVCTYLGRTSYPLYVLHMPLYILTSVAVRRLGMSPLNVGVASLAALLAVCWYLDVLHGQLRRRISRGPSSVSRSKL